RGARRRSSRESLAVRIRTHVIVQSARPPWRTDSLGTQVRTDPHAVHYVSLLFSASRPGRSLGRNRTPRPTRSLVVQRRIVASIRASRAETAGTRLIRIAYFAKSSPLSSGGAPTMRKLNLSPPSNVAVPARAPPSARCRINTGPSVEY